MEPGSGPGAGQVTTGVSGAETGPPPVEVRRSRRRRRTVSAFRAEDGTVVVQLPARMSAAEEGAWVATMLERLERSEARRAPSDDGLCERAARLCAAYLDGLAPPASVRWVDNQRSRWGSCTPADGSIRLSSRLRGMPSWVIDYVLLHELAHLVEPGHNAAFWALVNRFPRAERAKGYLEGVASAARWTMREDDVLGSASLEASQAPADQLV